MPGVMVRAIAFMCGVERRHCLRSHRLQSVVGAARGALPVALPAFRCALLTHTHTRLPVLSWLCGSLRPRCAEVSLAAGYLAVGYPA